MIGNVANLFTGHWPLATGHYLAAGFINPAFFLAGALLVAVPILIHILNRRRYKTVEWAAMEFLLRAMRKNRRRLRFEQWLLLAMRCLVLLLLGLALARPVACTDSTLASLAGQRSGLHVFVIDNSYSMAYEADRPDARTHLDQAKRLAGGLVDRMVAGGEAVVVINAAAPATGLIEQPSYDLASVRSSIDRIEQTNAATDLPGALQKALEIGQRETNLARRHLYLFTDATRSAWETGNADNLKQLGAELAKVYHITHYNLGRQNQWNHAALNLRPSSNIVTNRFNNDVVATLGGYGTGPEPTLQWKLDDRLLPGGGTVRFDAGDEKDSVVQAPVKTGGTHSLTASLVSDDRLDIDNTRWRVVDVAAGLKVLIVEGDRGIGPLSGSAAFLELALAPPKEAGGNNTGAASDSYVAPEIISDLELGNRVLTDYRAVILTNVAQLQPPQADQLRQFVEQGGLVMLFMGEQVDRENYNSVLLPRSLMPGTLTKRMSVSADQKGFLFDFQPHGNIPAVLKVFENEEKSGLDAAQVFTYWQVELPSDGTVDRVLNYLPQDGAADTVRGQQKDPAITVHSIGNGRVVFVSTTADADWTSLPAKLAYVPLMHELLAGSVSAGDAWMNLQVGQSLEIPPSVKLTAAPILTDSRNRSMSIDQTTNAAGQGIYRSEPITEPGLYTLSTGSRTVPIAVNVPADEADVRTVDDRAIKSLLGDVEVQFEADQLPELAESEDEGNDFGWSIMLAVLALVGLECFFAMQFGHYRRKH